MTPIPPTGRVLALDWGARRIGIAVSDETQLVASPVAVLTRRTGRRFPRAEFLTIVARERPVGLVVGLPLDDDGREGESAVAARAMGTDCSDHTRLPLEFTDESFTTAKASAALHATGQRVDRDRIDALAAATLLQEWLDMRATRRPR